MNSKGLPVFLFSRAWWRRNWSRLMSEHLWGVMIEVHVLCHFPSAPSDCPPGTTVWSLPTALSQDHLCIMHVKATSEARAELPGLR